MATEFQDQVATVLQWFLKCNECEQVVVLCSILHRISSLQAKFVAQVFEQMFKTSTDPAIDQQELQANDPGYVSSLAKESRPTGILQLLKSLPLLRVGNEKAKSEYLQIVPHILAYSLKHGVHLEECRHLLSYLIIHPAFSREDLPKLSVWQKALSEVQTNSMLHYSAPVLPNAVPQRAAPTPIVSSLASSKNNSVVESISGSEQDNFGFTNTNMSASLLSNAGNSARQWTLASSSRDSGFSEADRGSSVAGIPIGRPLRPSASVPLTAVEKPTIDRLIQPVALPSRAPVDLSQSQVSSNSPVANTVTDWLDRHLQPTVGNRPPHFGIGLLSSSLHAPLSPQSSVTSSGSGGSVRGELHMDERRRSLAEDAFGMQDVNSWLKNLRLHKYAHLFQNITYEEMLNLNEEWLEEHNVTKGARNKILLSIKKLQSRQETLHLLEKDLLVAGNIKQTIDELAQMLQTPMKKCASSKPSAQEKGASTADDGKQSTLATTKNGVEPQSSVETDSITDGDLPGHITRLLGKVCAKLLVGARPDGECLRGYLHLLDRTLSHHAFTQEQKKKLTSWKQQMYRMFRLHAIQKQNQECQAAGSHENVIRTSEVAHVERRALRGQQLSSNDQQNWSFGVVGQQPSPCVPNALFLAGQHSESPSTTHFPQYQNDSASVVSVLEGKQPLGRTKSAPIRLPEMGSLCTGPLTLSQDTDDDLHASLNSLCISMAEGALGGGGF